MTLENDIREFVEAIQRDSDKSKFLKDDMLYKVFSKGSALQIK